jgi:two-component system chemotaxis response regulator CheB
MSIALARSAEHALAPERLRVMVVDDAVVVRGMIARWIKAEHDLEIVASMRGGREALEQVEQKDPDVVVLDVTMPDAPLALPRTRNSRVRK